MAARSSWKGYLQLSLVSIPVKAFTATASGGGEVRLNQLHNECKSRIKYQKTCPTHGVIPNDEIVKGYEFAKDQYVVIDDSELDSLRTESDKAINVDKFVSPDDVDPVYFSGKNYYLTPDGLVGQKPYALLHRAMSDEGLVCVAQVVMHGKEQLVILRPLEKLICMTMLNYPEQVKQADQFEDEVTDGEFPKDELKLTKTLVAATTTDEFDISDYKNVYTEKLTQLIEAKVEGREIHAIPDQQPQQVINLMEALKASVEKAETSAKKKPAKKKMASSARKRPAAAKKKKKTG